MNHEIYLRCHTRILDDKPQENRKAKKPLALPMYVLVLDTERYALYDHDRETIRLIKVSEHGLGLYYRPKEGRDSDCDVALWIKEGWQWILNQALGIQAEKPDWLNVPVMRRIAITTPNVMAALRRLNRDKARPYNFALSPVLVNLSKTSITLLGPFEKDSSLWGDMSYINIHDGTTYTLNLLPPLTLAQTFEMVFFQFHRHPEYKSLASDSTSCKADTAGLLKRYPVTATSFQPIGKETEHGWEQAEDMSTLMPSLVRYREKIAIPGSKFQARLQQSSLAVLQGRTGLSRHTILRARRGQKVRAKSLKLLRTATHMAQCIIKERPD